MAQPVAIVTGGASGIGLACTKNLLARGYKVCIADANPKSGDAAASELGSNTVFVRCDVSIYAEQAALFARAFHWGGGRLDFAALNAGIDDRQSLYESNETMKTEKIKIEGVDGEVEVPMEMNVKTMKVDLDAVLQGVWLFKWFNRRSKDSEGKAIGRGKIVCTSSAAGIYNIETNPQYGTAKHGIVGLVRSAAPVLYRQDKITLNALCPAFVMTNLAPEWLKTTFPKEHITPMSTMMKIYDTYLDDDTMHGQTVIGSLENLHFMKMPAYPDESMKWNAEDTDDFWKKAYEKVATAKGGLPELHEGTEIQ